jgi:uridine kinase
MSIQITVIPQAGAEPVYMEAMSGDTVGSVLKSRDWGLPFGIFAATVAGRAEDLNYRITEPVKIEFLDIRNTFADRTYQRSLTLIYLRSVREVLGEDANVTIFNSLSRGLYTEIDTDIPLSDVQIRRIEARMKRYAEEDLPITQTVFGREDLIEYLSRDERISPDRLELFKSAPDVHFIAVYEFDGYSNFFYGPMTPSSGYLNCFGLVRYDDGIMLRYPYPADPTGLPEMLEDFKLYGAFREGWTIADLCGIRFVGDLNNEISQGRANEVISLSERFHRARIDRFAEHVHARGKRIILIAGPSSSGKTTFAKRFAAKLAALGTDPLYLGTDDYFVERSESPLGPDGEPDFESVDAIDIDLYNSNILDLLSGKEVDIPTFNFLTGSKEFGLRKTSIEGQQPIIIEGLHPLNPLFSLHLPADEVFKIYIGPLTQLNLDDHNRIPTTDLRLIRRMLRDERTRGHSVEETIRDWHKVRQGENVNVFPYIGNADVVFNSALLYEGAVLKRHAKRFLNEIGPDSNLYSYAVRLLDFLSFFREIDEENEAAIPGDSILREFIGGGSV